MVISFAVDTREVDQILGVGKQKTVFNLKQVGDRVGVDEICRIASVWQ
ncbi:MAG: hypothetical protein AAGG45_01205 [Pseudomonadota bacterium]